jgi:Leucine-rich repeat (LRR) protein
MDIESLSKNFDKLKARSHRYDEDNATSYVDTTRYDKDYNYLDMGYQRLNKFTMDLNNYPQLTTLFINNNNLSYLPDHFVNLRNLTSLDCSYNNLKTIPLINSLTNLNCQHNQLNNCLFLNQMKELKVLDISFNPVSDDINRYFFPSLTELYCSNCSINQLNPMCYPKLEILDCSFNNIEVLPTFNFLIELMAKNNNLTQMMPQLHLLRLDVSNNKLNYLPTLPKCEIIIASENRLIEITYASGLQSVEKMNVSHNKLKIISSVPQLKNLDVSNNQLEKLMGLPSLKNLNIASNSCFIPDLALISTTKELYLDYDIYYTLFDHLKSRIKYISFDVNIYSLKRLIKNNFDSDKLIGKIILDCFIECEFKNHLSMLQQLASFVFHKLKYNKIVITEINYQENPPAYKLYKILKKIYYSILIVSLCFKDK